MNSSMNLGQISFHVVRDQSSLFGPPSNRRLLQVKMSPQTTPSSITMFQTDITPKSIHSNRKGRALISFSGVSLK